MQFMPMEMQYWQTRFRESNWPLCGTFRSYLFFQLHNHVNDYSRLRNKGNERLMMVSHFDGFHASLEAIEAEFPIRERATNMLEDLDGDYEEVMPLDYPGFKRSILSLLDQMDEVASRVDWAREQIHQHFLFILDAHDPSADTDLELRAEFNDSDARLREILKEIKEARDAVLWEGSPETVENYFTQARRILVPESRYEFFRREHTPQDSPDIFNVLRDSVDELELTLEVNELWVKHTC
jgi:hypothetical protein